VSSVAHPKAPLAGPLLRQRLGAAVGYALAILVALLFLLPLFWMISSSLKPNYQVLEFPPRWIPDPIT
jgi:multiple sugar transport system permease protein